ncbi:hypothetical protein HanXRQr2_Chr16g0763541 [Helianthus annuus]|uniref:Uncharacterized protein n=1 Tax=Helianthus annuus TaxID=4232 RepID=A0A9K3GZ51_HELAN|nr:hypothetical protein HanXRQr2_Chr16g0763541 [Helianthus annuus]KAJ0822410.1 hypothetical protein HanPSC8_Chr16g0731681 [Helianthus annuus]
MIPTATPTPIDAATTTTIPTICYNVNYHPTIALCLLSFSKKPNFYILSLKIASTSPHRRRRHTSTITVATTTSFVTTQTSKICNILSYDLNFSLSLSLTVITSLSLHVG